MIEESGNDHWTDRETDAELTLLLGLPACRSTRREREPRDPGQFREPAHGIRRDAAREAHSCLTFPAPSC